MQMNFNIYYGDALTNYFLSHQMKTLRYKYIKGKKVKIPISKCSVLGINKEKFRIMRNRKSIKGSIYGHVANDITWPGNQIITNLFFSKI